MAKAKIIVECPACGNNLSASTSFFRRDSRAVVCNRCGETIDPRQQQMDSVDCPYCPTKLVFKKTQDSISCPGCKRKFNPIEEYAKKTTVNCPQCACNIHLTPSADQDYETECPLCGKRFNVARAFAHKKVVEGDAINVLRYTGGASTLIWKHPVEDFNSGTWLIVDESQEAVFYLNGQALDSLYSGRHTLTTESLPEIKRVGQLPPGSVSSFHAKVYFINKSVVQFLWGTPDRIRFLDPITRIPLNIGANGRATVQVDNARKLLRQLLGTGSTLTAEDISSFFRGMIRTEVKSHLAAAIKNERINILEFDEKLTTLSTALLEKIRPRFVEYGLSIIDFCVDAIALPDDDPNFMEIKNMITEAYFGAKKQEIKADIVNAENQVKKAHLTGEVELARLEAEKERIRAQAEADRTKMIGTAEAEVMSAKGYNYKDVLDAETQRAYAPKPSGNGGVGSGIVQSVTEVATAAKVAEIVTEQLGRFAPTTVAWTCECGHKGNKGRFCEVCGKQKPTV
ncbi:hypothetical protein FACS1894196_2400 [Clostridia bacterium]|nr:hypothetical protein FACS1894196_2400 [Clostridia bacterium]